MKSRQANDFMKKDINYTACNEDSNSEYSFFRFSGSECLLCLLGGGERFFNLLTYDESPEKAILVDANPTQKFTFELKKQAFISLSYRQFCDFIGLRKMIGVKRLYTYELLRGDLSEEARTYWDSHISLISRGLLYQGNFEKFLSIVGRAMRIIFPKGIKLLFQAKSLEEQKDIFNRYINGIKWRAVLRLACKKIWFRVLSKDPCFYMNEGIGDYYSFFKNKFEYAIKEIPIQENFLLSLIYLGKYDFEHEIFPRCYRKEFYETVKCRLKTINVSLEVNHVITYLEGSNERFDCYSLSDVCSYLCEDEIPVLLQNVYNTANYQAKIVIRELLTRFDMDKILSTCHCRDDLERNRDQESLAKQNDSSFIWNFYFYNVKG